MFHKKLNEIAFYPFTWWSAQQSHKVRVIFDRVGRTGAQPCGLKEMCVTVIFTECQLSDECQDVYLTFGRFVCTPEAFGEFVD
ncbi:hypothetical protein I7I48_09931 [Histoplasma ohiense]|nr:hypothetical protein I7I48_09931 [Histoplasma ohiense (nom. inval.)]